MLLLCRRKMNRQLAYSKKPHWYHWTLRHISSQTLCRVRQHGGEVASLTRESQLSLPLLEASKSPRHKFGCLPRLHGIRISQNLDRVSLGRLQRLILMETQQQVVAQSAICLKCCPLMGEYVAQLGREVSRFRASSRALWLRWLTQVARLAK